MDSYVDVVESWRLFYMKPEQVLRWSVHLESSNLFEGEFEDMRIRFCWVNGEIQDAVTCFIPFCQ